MASTALDEETPAASAQCLLVVAKAKPVALRRKSTPDAGMQEENHECSPTSPMASARGVSGAIQCRSRARSSLHRGTRRDGRGSLSTHSQRRTAVTCHG